MYYWRLTYLDGRLFDEPQDGGSIRDTPPNPAALYVMKQGKAEPLWRIPLDHGARPVWYRKCSIGMKEGQLSGPQTDATVFGFAQDAGNEINSHVWMMQNDKALDVPEEYLDKDAIEFCFWRQ